MPTTNQQPDMKRWPWRGTYRAVADQLTRAGHSITKQGVRQQVIRGNREMRQLVEKELARRAALLEGKNR